jgi:serine/threonine protein kinase
MEGCFSPDFERYCLTREWLGPRDLRRIINRVGVHSLLESFVLDLSIFEGCREMGLIQSRSGSEVSMKQYCRQSDGFEIVVKSHSRFACEKVEEILYELFQLTQLKHRCIAPLIGIVLPTDSTPLQTATLYYCCGSLEVVLDKNPEWWTPTTKAKAIAGIALGMQSAHQHGIAHDSLNPNNILFDEDHCVHIVDFDSSHFQAKQKDQNEMNDMDEESDAQRMEDAKKSDVFSFATVMFAILVDRSSSSHSLSFDEDENRLMNNGEVPMIPEFVPEFVRELIANGWSADRSERDSFEMIIEIMQESHFLFAEGVDECKTLEFVNTVEQ